MIGHFSGQLVAFVPRGCNCSGCQIRCVWPRHRKICLKVITCHKAFKPFVISPFGYSSQKPIPVKKYKYKMYVFVHMRSTTAMFAWIIIMNIILNWCVIVSTCQPVQRPAASWTYGSLELDCNSLYTWSRFPITHEMDQMNQKSHILKIQLWLRGFSGLHITPESVLKLKCSIQILSLCIDDIGSLIIKSIHQSGSDHHTTRSNSK